jgi:hypothetical protein
MVFPWTAASGLLTPQRRSERFMAKCAKCKTEETTWYEGGVPICFSCANARQEAKLDAMNRTAAARGQGEPQAARTDLHEAGVPICPDCSDARTKSRPPKSAPEIRAALIDRIVGATGRVIAANGAFSAVMNQVPSGLPHPDGTQRIHNLSRELDAARKEMMEAHTRLNDFIERGVVPEDLKQGS